MLKRPELRDSKPKSHGLFHNSHHKEPVFCSGSSVRTVAAETTRGGGGGWGGFCLTVQAQVVGGDQQLEAQLDGNVHVWDVFTLPVAVPVLEILADLLEDNATVGTLWLDSSRKRTEESGRIVLRMYVCGWETSVGRGNKECWVCFRSSVVGNQADQPLQQRSVSKNTAK